MQSSAAGEPSATAAAGLSHVTFSRRHPDDVQHRQIYARIDQEPAHTLLFGDVVTVMVAPGEHRLRANNTLFWKSVVFTIEPDQHLEFALVNRAGRLSFGFLALLGAAPMTLSIERR